MTTVIAETPRVKIVRLDLAAVTAAIDDRERLSRILNAAIDSDWPLKDMRDLLRFIRNQLGANASAVHWGGVIIARDPDTLIGDIGFHASPVDGQVEVGYSVVPSHRGMGFATEALRAFLSWGFRSPEIKRIIARCEAGNLGSRRVLEKSGLMYEGDFDGFLRFTMERPKS